MEKKKLSFLHLQIINASHDISVPYMHKLCDFSSDYSVGHICLMLASTCSDRFAFMDSDTRDSHLAFVDLGGMWKIIYGDD